MALDTCTHHWLLDPPESEMSRGACKRCGEIREFSNRVSLTWSETQGAIGFGAGIFANPVRVEREEFE